MGTGKLFPLCPSSVYTPGFEMKLKDQKVLMFVDHIFEDMELLYPYYRLIEEGAEVVVAGRTTCIVV